MRKYLLSWIKYKTSTLFFSPCAHSKISIISVNIVCYVQYNNHVYLNTRNETIHVILCVASIEGPFTKRAEWKYPANDWAFWYDEDKINSQKMEISQPANKYKLNWREKCIGEAARVCVLRDWIWWTILALRANSLCHRCAHRMCCSMLSWSGFLLLFLLLFAQRFYLISCAHF